LIGISHYLGLIHVIAQFTWLVQFVTQEELARMIPFLTGLVCMGIGAGLLVADMTTSALMYILGVVFPFIEMIQYYAIYITYDVTGYDTGIHWGQNIVSSGLLINYVTQIVGIALYLRLCAEYGQEKSPFAEWISRHLGFLVKLPDAAATSEAAAATTTHHQESTLSGDCFESLAPGSNVVIRVRGVEHTYHRAGRYDCSKSNNHHPEDKKETEVLKGLDMDICRGEVFGYLGHNGAGSKFLLYASSSICWNGCGAQISLFSSPIVLGYVHH